VRQHEPSGTHQNLQHAISLLFFFLSFPQGIRFTFARKREPVRPCHNFGCPIHSALHAE
jgi:hypothetical protein